jgi:hypothetical protein
MASQPIDPQEVRSASWKVLLWGGIQTLAVEGPLPDVGRLVGGPTQVALNLTAFALLLASVVALPLYGYRTCRALRSRAGLLIAALMLVPWVNVIGFLILISMRRRTFKNAGIPGGLLGPPRAQRPPVGRAATSVAGVAPRGQAAGGLGRTGQAPARLGSQGGSGSRG